MLNGSSDFSPPDVIMHKGSGKLKISSAVGQHKGQSRKGKMMGACKGGLCLQRVTLSSIQKPNGTIFSNEKMLSRCCD